MGRISKSFKGQIGRDAGKVVSNVIFGDAHATPYRRAKGKGSSSRSSSESHSSFDDDSTANDIAVEEFLNNLDGAVIENVDQIIELEIGNDKEHIEKLMEALEIQLSVNKWNTIYFKRKLRIKNKYPDAVLKKYKLCIKKLARIGIDEEELKYYQQIAKKYTLIQIVSKHYPVILLLLFVLVVLVLRMFGVIRRSTFYNIFAVMGSLGFIFSMMVLAGDKKV